jgi:hypothetical protein
VAKNQSTGGPAAWCQPGAGSLQEGLHGDREVDRSPGIPPPGARHGRMD